MNSTNRVVAFLAVSAFASTCSFRILDPAIPQLSEEFGVSTGTAGDGVMWFALAYGIMQFFYGPIGDRFGKYRVLALATLASALGSLAVALAPTFQILLLGRFLTGATCAGIIPLALAWIGDHVPYERRQETLARFILGNIIGVTSGLWIGGAFTDITGWRGGVLFLVALYLIIGTILFLQRSHVPEVQAPYKKIKFLEPILLVFSSGWAWVVLITAMFEGGLVYGAIAYVPAYLQYTYEISATLAGITTGMFAIGALLYVVNARWLIAKLGELKLVACGGIMLGSSYFLYLEGPTWHWAMLGSVVCGFGYYFLHAVLQARATQMVEKARSTGVSMFACFMFLGQALGIILGSFVVDAFGLRFLLWISVATLPILGFWFNFELRKHISRQQQAAAA